MRTGRWEQLAVRVMLFQDVFFQSASLKNLFASRIAAIVIIMWDESQKIDHWLLNDLGDVNTANDMQVKWAVQVDLYSAQEGAGSWNLGR